MNKQNEAIEDIDNVVFDDLTSALKSARERQNQSVSFFADKLKIPLVKLQRIESEVQAFSELNAFERGYLKSYAAILEVDLKEFESLWKDIDSKSENNLKQIVDGESMVQPVFSSMKMISWSVFLLFMVLGVTIVSLI